MELLDTIFERLKTPIRNEVYRTFAKLDKIATGKTVDSTRITSRTIGDKLEILIDIGGGAKYIDSGRRPFTSFPNIGDIREWMEAKSIDAPVYVIARGIYEKGIEPVPLQETLDDALSIIIEQETDIQVQNFVDNIFTSFD